MLPKKRMIRESIPAFKRMKTVFAHANIEEGTGAAISSVVIDKKGKFIITGGDDQLIKIWHLNTGQIQASLHGHLAVICDIALSPCERFIASGSKDGKVIIWSLEDF